MTNIFELLRNGAKQEVMDYITERFREAAAEGHRHTLAVEAAMEIYDGDNKKALEFLKRPHPMFGGETPYDVAGRSNEGLTEVIRLLGSGFGPPNG